MKLVSENIRELNECKTKNNFLRMNDLNKIKTQRICAKRLKFSYEGPIDSEIILTRARKLLVKIQISQPCFTEEKAKLSLTVCKDFVHQFRDNFILCGADLLEGFSWFSMCVYKKCNKIYILL